MASYRGKRFIAEQLHSIVTQSKPPSEVVVFDDVSDDGTIDVVKKYASESKIPIIPCLQTENRGVNGNFESAIKTATGDIVFLSDQDDVWYPHKISRIVDAFDRDPQVGLVFSDADLVDENLNPMGRTLWQSIRFTQAQREQIRSPHAFELLLRRFLVTGATLAFRRSLVDLVLPISRHLIHDAWIALAIAAVSKIQCIDEPLIQYRQHARQQIGDRDSWRSWHTQWRAAKNMSPNYFDRQRLFFCDLANRLNDHRLPLVRPNLSELAKQKAQHLERRIHFRKKQPGTLAGITREYMTGEYSRFSFGWKSAAQDLFL